MKSLFTTLFTLMVSITTLFAQDNVGVNFNEGKSFAEILQMAKEQNKPVFIDCYTSWCGPCKRMARDVFPQKKAGDYFNAKFVCWKIDMEKGEGPALAKKYDVNAYPTFLMLNNDGEFINRYVGGSDLETFIGIVDKAMESDNPLVTMKKKFEAGERNADFINEYVDLLEQNYMSGEKKNVIATTLSAHSAKEIASDEALYAVFRKGGFSPKDDIFIQIYKERATVAEKLGEKAAKGLDRTWVSAASRYLKFSGKEYKEFDAEGYAAFLEQAKALNVPDLEAFNNDVMLRKAFYSKDYPELYVYIMKALSVDDADDAVNNDLVYHCKTLANNSKDFTKKQRKELGKAFARRANYLKAHPYDNGRRMYFSDTEFMTMCEYYIKEYSKMAEEMKK